MSVGAVNKQTGERIPAAGMPAVDAVLSGTSTNPVQNKVVKEALDAKQDTLTFDDTPTDGSNNPVKSNGIYDALVDKANKTAMAIGETLSLVPTSEGRALLHTAYGMSVQDGTPTPSSPVNIVSAKANFISTDGENTQNVTTDLTLLAIEVTSSDAYNLVRDGKYYIADTLDYSEDNGFVVTRRVGDTDLSNFGYTYISGTQVFQTAITGIKNTEYNKVMAISEGFVYHTGQMATMPNGGMRLNANGENYVNFKNTALTDPTEFKAAVSGIRFVYILATPTTETITTAQALALLGLKTYNESTTISSQAEPACTVSVEYAKERLGALALTGYLELQSDVAELTDDVALLDSNKADTDMVAADFNAGTSYTAGNYCVQDGKLYKFKNNHSGAWSSADVDEVKITGELSALKSGLTSVSVYNLTHINDEHGNINDSAFSSGSASIAITGKLATVSINFVTTKTGLDWVIQLKDAPETKVYFTAYIDSNRVTGYVEYLNDLQIWNVYIPNQAPNSVVSATFTYVLAN